MCLLSNDIYDYYIVSQGKTTIPNLDDGEELVLTDVSQPCKGITQGIWVECNHTFSTDGLHGPSVGWDISPMNLYEIS